MKLAITLAAIALMIAIGSFGMARNSAAVCDLDKSNAAWCDGAVKVPGVRQW